MNSVNCFFDQSGGGGGTVFLSIDGEISAAFELEAPTLPESKDMVATLRRRGRHVAILSGDTQASAVKAGLAIGLSPSDCMGDLQPEDKMEIIGEGSTATAMVGDGINDAAAMKLADVAIGVKGGLESMLEVVDVFISMQDVRLIAETFEGADRTMRLARVNLLLSACYNFIAGTAALLGMVDPLVAAVLMPISSASVIAIAIVGKTFSVNKRNG